MSPPVEGLDGDDDHHTSPPMASAEGGQGGGGVEGEALFNKLKAAWKSAAASQGGGQGGQGMRPPQEAMRAFTFMPEPKQAAARGKAGARQGGKVSRQAGSIAGLAARLTAADPGRHAGSRAASSPPASSGEERAGAGAESVLMVTGVCVGCVAAGQRVRPSV